VTFHGSNGNDIWLALPPWDWQLPEAGKVLSYVTDPLSETAVMAGSGSIDLWLQSTAPDTDLQVTLSEVRPDGKETYVQAGWLRASHRKLNDAASSVLRPVHTNLESDAADLLQGKYVLARVELFPFAHVFRAASRIRLTVESPGGDRPLWKFDVLPADSEVTTTIARSAAHSSRVVLPLVPDIEVTTQLPACPALRGQPCRTYEELVNTPG
jgi:predicted acyl esterase